MYNKSVHTSTFPDKLKSAEVIPCTKKMKPLIKPIIDQ